MDDRNDEESEEAWPPPRTNEGVRILGAEEAREALESGQVQHRLGEDVPHPGDVPQRPEPPVPPVARFPLPPGSPGVSWTAAGDSDDAAEDIEDAPVVAEEIAAADEPSAPVALPHWTEPATGEVPRILPEDDIEADDDAWAAFASKPRFRTDADDWEDHDFDTDMLKNDDTSQMGALAEVVDDDDEFDAQVAQRRTRRPSSSRPEPRRAGGGRAPRPAADDLPEPAEPVGPPPDLSIRVVTAGVVAVVALLCFAIGRGATALLVAVVAALACLEFCEGLRRRGFSPATLIATLGSAAIVLVAYDQGTAAFPLVGAVVVVFSLLWYLFEAVPPRAVTVNVALTVFAFGYIGGLAAFAGLMLGAPHGVGLIIGLALCAIAYDVAGYFVGSQLGKSRLMPRVSPNKTVEGLVGGMIASICVGVLTSTILGLTPWDDKAVYGLWLGVIIAVMAPLGDLCESLIKRDLGVKDFGSILPGHGGVLDRFDGIVFTLPAVYYLVLHLGIG